MSNQYTTISNRRVECTCKQCGKQFSMPQCRIDKGDGKYCSRDCYSLSRHKRIDCVCIICGKSFYEFPSGIKEGRGRFCSRKCSDKSHRVECICQYCGKSFSLMASRLKDHEQKFCSRDCMSLAIRGKNSPSWRGGHSSKRGENWNKQRRLAYERDQGRCQHCGKSHKEGHRRFDIHHIRPYHSFNGDYLAANDLTNLITLCRKCHKQAEYGKIAIQPLLLQTT